MIYKVLRNFDRLVLVLFHKKKCPPLHIRKGGLSQNRFTLKSFIHVLWEKDLVIYISFEFKKSPPSTFAKGGLISKLFIVIVGKTFALNFHSLFPWVFFEKIKVLPHLCKGGLQKTFLWISKLFRICNWYSASFSNLLHFNFTRC